MNRRDFLCAAIGLSLAERSVAMEVKSETSIRLFDDVLVSSANDAKGNHYLIKYHALSGKVMKFPIENRGHEAVITPDNQFALLMARRPGNIAYAQSLDHHDLPMPFYARENRHFYGHSTFIENGRYLLTTENDYEKQKGVIGVRDAFDDYKWIDEFESHGIGCHEIEVLSDGKTLIVANGGILTHPSKKREKLNLETMQSNLAYIDISSGSLINLVSLDDQQMSIRHISVLPNDHVSVACQHQSNDNIMSPLIFFVDDDASLKGALIDDEFNWLSYENYTGSICAHENGFTCVTSPRGNKVAFFSHETRRLAKEYYFPDVSGVAISNDRKHFVCTSGKGEIRYFDALSFNQVNELTQKINFKWDNHLMVV